MTRGDGKRKGRKEMFYLMTHSTHFIYDYMVSDMVKERVNLLPPHGLLFLIRIKGSFISIIPDRIIHTTAFITPVMEHWLEREIAQWVHHMTDRSDDPSNHEQRKRKNIFYLMTISTHFIYCYMALDIW